MPQYEGGLKPLKILFFADSTGQSSKMQYNHKNRQPVLPVKTTGYRSAYKQLFCVSLKMYGNPKKPVQSSKILV